MPVKYNFSNPDIHWRSFYFYAVHKTDTFIGLDANRIFRRIEPVLKEYNGKFIWPDKNKRADFLDTLEFDTYEDLLFFKLKFN